jgi:transposase InsO family protein
MKKESERLVGGILIDDNAPCHAAKDTRQRLQELGIERLL